MPAAVQKAKDHRQKLFGWLSWEMVAQSAGGIATLLILAVHLSDKLDDFAVKQTEMGLQLNGVKASIEVHTQQLAVQQSQSADQSAKIKVLFDGHQEDQKTINEVDKNVGILLDRSKPKTP